MYKIIKIKDYRKERVDCREKIAFRYNNIICLNEKAWENNENITRLYFYDIIKEKIVDLNGWTTRLNQYDIFTYRSTETCIFILATHLSKRCLICLDFENGIWQECPIAGIFTEPTYECRNSPIQYDGQHLYLGFIEPSTGLWDYYAVCQDKTNLSLKKLRFFDGKIHSFQPYDIYKGRLICSICGENVSVYDKDGALLQKLPDAETLLCYDGNSVEIIYVQTNPELLLCYYSIVGNVLYYAACNKNDEIPTERDDQHQYNLCTHQKLNVSLNDEYLISSYGYDMYIYSDTFIKRISDNKTITVDEIMGAIQKLGYEEEMKEIKPFPSMCLFYSNWIEIEIPDIRFFVVNIETMQAYYFDKMIELGSTCIYVYE